MTSTPTVATPAPSRQPKTTPLLAELERIIERGIETFVEVGHALMAIRDEKLYRPQHVSFEQYLSARWQPKLSRQHAHRLIKAAQVAEVLLPIGNVPANEAQARTLVPLLDQPEKLRDVAVQVHEAHGDKVTAAKLETAVRQVRKPLAPRKQPKARRAARPVTAKSATAPPDDLGNYKQKHIASLVDASHNLAVHAKSAGHKRCCWRPADAVLQIIRRLTRQLPAGAEQHEAP